MNHGLCSKYACFTCRRVFKFRAQPGHEHYWGWGGVRLIRPDQTRIADVWRAEDRLRRAGGEKWAYVRARAQAHWVALLDLRELEELKRCLPGAWWRRLEPCCPGCGQVGRIETSALEAPSQRDGKAWRELEARVQSGEERVLLESQAQDMLRENDVRWRRREGHEEREKEKHRRNEVLQKAIELGLRTTEEERRLITIRARKGKIEGDPWAVMVYPDIIEE